MHISELDTPALLIDLDRMERNLQRAADYCAKHGLRLRPHTKTHKNPAIGRLQLDRGAIGLTVAKVGEAEVMLDSGVEELLVAYPIVGASKLRRLMEVAKKTRVTVALDSVEAAQGLSQAAVEAGVEAGVLVEANAGLNRCGVEPGEQLTALAKQVGAMKNLRLLGVQYYAGHIWMSSPQGERQLAQLRETVSGIVADFRAAGLPTEIISGGSSPTLYHSHTIEGLNEVRPGTYVFNDCMQVAAGVAQWDDCAVSILMTVVSAARPGSAIIDGGSKTFTSDQLPGSGEPSFGRVVEDPEIRFFKMQEEHGYLNTERASGPVRVGDRLRVIPNHVCVAVNMHEKVYGVRGETVELEWKVAARGKLQ